MANAAGSSDPAKDSTKPDRTLDSTKVGNSDSQTPDCLCSSTKLRKNRKSHFKSTILWTARRCFSGVGRSNHIVYIVSIFYNFSFHQAAATAKSGKSASKSGSLKVEKLTKLLKLQITATTTLVSCTVSPSTS